MNISQLSVFVENKPGHLQKVLKVLADEDINIITLTIADTSDFGIIRMIVNETEKAERLLKEKNITCSLTDVLAVKIDNSPGALNKTIDAFSNNDVNIEYMYAFTSQKNNNPVMIFRIDDIDKAKSMAENQNIHIIKKEDIIN